MTIRPQTQAVLSEVYSERLRQVLRFGEQVIPDIAPGDDGADTFDGLSYDRLADEIRRENDTRPPEEQFMIPVLLEEVFEACEARAAGDISGYRAELIQVAALAVKAIELVDLRMSGEDR